MLSRICLTSAGDGVWPLWVERYDSITSAAAPAVSGVDWLTPPNCSSDAGVPAKLAHSW